MRSFDAQAFRQAAQMLDQVDASRLAALPPLKRAQKLSTKAKDYLDRGLLLEAERLYLTALASDDRVAEAHAGLAEVRERTGDAVAARKEAHTALELEPTVEAYLVLGRLDLAANQLSEAEKDDGAALKLAPQSRSAQELRRQIEARESPEEVKWVRHSGRESRQARSFDSLCSLRMTAELGHGAGEKAGRSKPWCSERAGSQFGQVCFGQPRWLSAGGAAPAPAQQPLVEKLVLSDTIQPVTEGELDRAIARANRDGAQALLVELDTPGGLLDSTRTMAGAILSSQVPVIVYVSPAGARAGSAGFFLLESADIAAMAPGTNAGAAHPVMEFGGQPDATMNQKIENDTEAFLRSYVTKRNRNAEAAEAAVHTSHSYTAEEALEQHLIDLTASTTGNCCARSMAARLPAWTEAS